MTTTQVLIDGALLLGVGGTMLLWGWEANRAAQIRRMGKRGYEMRNMRLQQSWDSGPQLKLGRELDRLGDQASGSASQGLGGGDGAEDSREQTQGGGGGQVRGQDGSQSPFREGTPRLPLLLKDSTPQKVQEAVDQADGDFCYGLESTGQPGHADRPMRDHYFSPDAQLDGRACAICGSTAGGIWHI